METVNNIAATASKAIWGETKQSGPEPISGQTGDTSKGEPYDAGNIEDPKTQAAKTEQTSGYTNGSTEHTKDAEFSKNTGTAAEAEETPDNPSTDLKTRSGPKDSSKDQNDTRDPENPQTNPKSAPTDVNDADDGPNKPQELGPGPKPLDEVAREHGGDAGNHDEKKTLPGEDKPEAEEEDEDGPNAKSTGEGTGEQYVKTSGLQADGGDFDATKPGAGREADRLLEEKGIYPTGGSKQEETSDAASGNSGEKKDKKSIGQKLKDKLHRH